MKSHGRATFRLLESALTLFSNLYIVRTYSTGTYKPRFSPADEFEFIRPIGRPQKWLFRVIKSNGRATFWLLKSALMFFLNSHVVYTHSMSTSKLSFSPADDFKFMRLIGRPQKWLCKQRENTGLNDPSREP